MGYLCERCWGTGDRDNFSGAPCFECNGTGWIDFDDFDDADEPEDDDVQESLDEQQR